MIQINLINRRYFFYTKVLIVFFLLLADGISGYSQNQKPSGNDTSGVRRGGFGGPIKLGQDAKPAFDNPPAVFRDKRVNIAHGTIATVQYDSITLSASREMLVYTPPGYSPDRKYPVIYLLHGLNSGAGQCPYWVRADHVIDNLLADGKIEPVIMVFPN